MTGCLIKKHTDYSNNNAVTMKLGDSGSSLSGGVKAVKNVSDEKMIIPTISCYEFYMSFFVLYV